jgi:hypothetical protein
MDIAPAFELTHPSLPDPDPEQGSLFSTSGSPMPAYLDALAARERARLLIRTIGIPAMHRPGVLAHLCDGTWVDPAALVWLGGSTHVDDWLAKVKAWPVEVDTGFGSSALAGVRDRALELGRLARPTQAWPQKALHALRQQRSAGGAFDVAMLPPLPEGLREWRHALLPVAMQCRALLYASFAQPVQKERGPGFRSVEVLDSFRVHFDFHRRFVTLSVRSPSGYYFPRYGQADLLEPLRTDDWCVCFANRLRQELRVALGAAWRVEHIEEMAADWLTALVKRLADRSQLLDHVRATIRAAYPCHRQVICDWQACRIDRRPGQGMSSGAYVWAWRRAETLRKRVAEAPQLAALWGEAVRLRHIGINDDYHALRRHAAVHGVTAAGWKLLARHSIALYRPLIHRIRNAETAYLDLFRYVRLLQRAQWQQPMPLVVMRAVFALHWYVDELDVADLPLGLIRGAIEQIRQPMPLGALDDFIEHQFIPVLGWLARAKPKLDANQQRASWAWFWARYQAWTEAERQRRETTRWAQGIDDLGWRGFAVVPIRDSATLWQEGERMRTCLTTYTNDCIAGRYLVYSIRTTGQPRPVAHIGLHINDDGTGRIDQVRGFANRPAEPALVEFGKRLARMRHVLPAGGAE